MKAIVRRAYGSSDEMNLEEIDTPTPGEGEVLVAIEAASVNASDCEFMTGRPIYTRMWGVRKPRVTILGSDIAGIVDAVGDNVHQFRPGDEVFGDIFEYWGGFAEIVCVPEKTLMRKPESMTFEQAASMPQAAAVALQGLSVKGNIERGQKVLINGAGGGAGSFALQLAKLFGAEVTGVDHANKFDMMRAAGADRVIDYMKDDFTNDGPVYDLILDLVARRSLFANKRALRPGGKYVMVGGTMPHILQAALLGPLISMTGSKHMGVLGARPNKDLDVLVAHFEAGDVVPVIDKTYPLEETATALQYVADGHARGKVVISVA